MTQKDILMAKRVDPNQYKADPSNLNCTVPGTWGAYSIPDEFVYGRKKKYRFGNHPARMIELKRMYGSVELIALFKNRDDAKGLADYLFENE